MITTLDDLLDTLTSCPACLAGADPLDEDAPAHTCGDLDWTALPTYGGEEPRDTSGVWSWDETRLLVGECASDLRIEDRDDTQETPASCPDCGEPREHRTCADCGHEADVIDCGHYAQPAEIAASAHASIPDHVCEDCERTRAETANAR